MSDQPSIDIESSTSSLPASLSEPTNLTPAQADIRRQVLEYYTAATADYRTWSKGLNMHFGYWRAGMNPFRRESMLQELNKQVLQRLCLSGDQPVRLIDLGGGTGATARAAVAAYSNVKVDVVTIVPTQIEMGRQLNRQVLRGDAITMHCVDFAFTNLPAGSADAVCMIESACHAEGPTKATVLAEAYRLLKPGGYFLMVDAMLLREIPKSGLISRLMGYAYRRWCLSWAVPEMCRQDLLPREMEQQGFETINIEDWSWNVAPSVAHVPVLASYFAVREIVKARGLLPLWRWRHIVASFLTPLIGLRRCTFTYAAVLARKPLNPAALRDQTP
ncbi:methyltransferase domain-containing protein [Pseudomonas sp. NPDC088368]|uniref:methyltransferase domain-containing protein n=1 Tax=Pseudomonas sp. NPDC088368 TaxID=3364453 RepID=UPI0038107B1E